MDTVLSEADPLVCDRHFLVEVAGLGLLCWRCGMPEEAASVSLPTLTALAKSFKTDKWGAHKYTPHYQRHFRPWRDREINLLEIGIGGYRRDGKGGASLRMWKAFFPHAQIYGLDKHDKSFVDEDRIRTFQGSQTDTAVLEAVVKAAGEFQIIIDDGSHRPAHIIETFNFLFPLLAANGIYVIEDTQTSYWPEFGGQEDPDATGTSMDLVKRLIDGLNYEEFVTEAYQPTYTDLHVTSVACYHNLVFIQKGDNSEGTRKQRILKKRYADGTQTDTRTANPNLGVHHLAVATRPSRWPGLARRFRSRYGKRR